MLRGLPLVETVNVYLNIEKTGVNTLPIPLLLMSLFFKRKQSDAEALCQRDQVASIRVNVLTI